MSHRDTTRRGVSNEGGFFSPYYLFDLMARRHRDELDFDGRERERRLLPRVFRAAMTRLAGDASLARVWSEWYGELFRALGLETQALDGGYNVPPYGHVPVSHFAVAPGGRALALLDLHPLSVDLDHDPYDPRQHLLDNLTREPIARAFEKALDVQDARWGLLSNGTELRLYRRGATVSRQFLRVDFAALFGADRDDEWTAFWGLFRREAFLPDSSGKCLLDRVLEESHRHASRIAENLRENAIEAVEALLQGVIDERANAAVWGGGTPDRVALDRLFEEALYFLYRLLFVFYAESRDVLPVGSRTYRDGYSIEHLRDLAERDLHPDDAGKTYYIDAVRTLFRLLRRGFRCSEFSIPALGGRGPEDADWGDIAAAGDRHLTSLFDGRRTLWLDRCRIPDRAMRTVIRELSLSRPKRRRDRRERYSYADLGVDQLGSIYEGLLAYEPTIAAEELVLAVVGRDVRLLPRSQAESSELNVVEGWERRQGTFVLRQWGGLRKGTGSYYTPHEITSFLVKEALDPVVAPLIRRCAEAWSQARKLAADEAARSGGLVLPFAATRIADEILDIKVCDPAMGSGAFLVQACRYLAEAYGRALIAEGRDDSGRIELDELARYKRLVAERCLYGVDLNPLAVELAKVSVWLETLAEGRPLSFLDAHLRCGNSLVGAPLRDGDGRFTADGIAVVPSVALKLSSAVDDEVYVAAVKALVKKNDRFLRARERRQAGRDTMALYGLDERALRSALDDYVATREALTESDEGRSNADALRLREEKERRFRDAHEAQDAPIRRLRRFCDLWCSAWFWPEEERTVGFDSEAYRDAVDRLLHGQTVADGWFETAGRIARERRFFHWELEFPEIFLRERPGFDVVVGNPPWEKVSGDAGELAKDFDPLIRLTRGAERDERVAAILADPVAGPFIVSAARVRGQEARFSREGPLFAGLVRGEVNTFAPFTVLSWRMHRDGGGMGIVLKDAFHLTESLGPIRAEILSHGAIRLLASSDNERKIFDAHHLLRFDLLVASRGAPADRVPISIHRFRTAQEVIDHVKEGAEVPVALLLDDEGRPSEPIPEILDPWWSRLFAKARQAAEGSTRVRWGAELHSSGDKACWTREGRPEDSPGPVLAMVGAFDAFAYEPMAWLVPDARAMPAFRKVVWGSWRVAVRDRVNQKDERVLIGAIVPAAAATCHYLNLCRSPVDDAATMLTIAGLANSLLADYLSRPMVGIHMTAGILNKLPWVLPVDPAAKLQICESVLRLTCCRDEYADLPAAAGWESEVGRAVSPADRAAERARLEAAVARVYDLTAHEWAHVLAWFRLLDQAQPPLPGEPQSFITRDLALLEYFRQTGMAPPKDVVAFFREAEVDLSHVTGETRDLEERVRAATALGAVAYLPSSRARGRSAKDSDPASCEDQAP